MTTNRSVIWGVDPGVHRLAIAIRGVSDNELMLISLELDTDEQLWQKRLSRTFWHITERMSALIEKSGFPLAIALERPSAHGRTNVHLVQTYGVIQAALASALHVFAGETIWLECGASEWKKAVLGNGNAQPFEYCAALRERQLEFQNADEAAAYWISEWADQRIVR
jgi:Holliday junction resolvasome RuvABC endonuclease subunit